MKIVPIGNAPPISPASTAPSLSKSQAELLPAVVDEFIPKVIVSAVAPWFKPTKNSASDSVPLPVPSSLSISNTPVLLLLDDTFKYGAKTLQVICVEPSSGPSAAEIVFVL